MQYVCASCFVLRPFAFKTNATLYVDGVEVGKRFSLSIQNVSSSPQLGDDYSAQIDKLLIVRVETNN